jgi:hypothetical protein
MISGRVFPRYVLSLSVILSFYDVNFFYDACELFFFFLSKQYLSECGDRYRYIVLNGDEVPNWFSYVYASTTFSSKGCNSISIHLPSLPKDQIKGLFVCVVCGPIQSPDWLERNALYVGVPIKINNRYLKLERHSGFSAWIPVTFNRERYCCIMYIPNPFTEDEIASGMEMTISLESATLIEVKEFGIHLVVDEPNAIMDSEYSMDMASAKRGRDDHDNGAGSSNDLSSDENCQKRSRIVDSEV